MPVIKCEKDGQSGYKWGESGTCYIGDGAKEKAEAQGRAIEINKCIAELSKQKVPTEQKQGIVATLTQWIHNLLHSEPPFDESGSIPAESSFDPNLVLTKKGAVYKSDKLDEEKRLVTGIVLQPEVVDAHGDVISVEEIEKTAHEFMEKFRAIGEQHLELAEAVPVESFTAKDDMELGGEKVLKGSWVLTVKVLNDELWEAVKNGSYTGFSIGGFSSVETLEQ